ncbi:MAG: DUF4271 domain-containing protein [Bacteroidia bacterium]|nr:DUF4271 domain-containing protein [Bacteroidia bacterium]
MVAQQSDSIGVGFSSFEHVPTDSTRLFFDVDTVAVVSSAEQMMPGFSGTLMPFSQTIQSVFFLFFALCFVILAFWFNREGPTLVANFKNIFSGGTRSRSIFKEEITTSGAWSEVFLVFQTVLIAAIVVFVLSLNRDISGLPMEKAVFVFLAIFLGMLLFIVVKYMVYRLIDYIFTEWGINEWTDKYFRVVELAGLLIFIPAMFFVFVPEYTRAALFLLIIIFFIITLVVFWNLLNIFARNKVGLLNYLLYLCAIEIVPFFLIYKGVVYLVNIAGN